MPSGEPDPRDEPVDLVDEAGRVLGRAPRREVRAKNLLHPGVGILCWNRTDELYVHRRTETKDVFPGLYDMFVGGVVACGESYESAAAREVEEELGIAGAALEPLFVHVYRGPHNWSRVAVFELEWNGPIRHQASEVAWGAWMRVEELDRRIAEWPFVPDGLELYRLARARRAGRFGARSEPLL